SVFCQQQRDVLVAREMTRLERNSHLNGNEQPQSFGRQRRAAVFQNHEAHQEKHQAPTSKLQRSTKHQAPKKHQAPSSKEAPSTKLQRNTEHQAPSTKHQSHSRSLFLLELGIWSFFGAW